MPSLFPRDVCDEILDLIEAVFEGFPTYLYLEGVIRNMLFVGVVGWCDGAG